MRLSNEQRLLIRNAAARTLGPAANVRLFGSRTQPDTKGGDIDLFVELDGNATEVLEQELKFYAALQRALGEQRIDVVVHRRGMPLRPIDHEAIEHGERI